MKISYSNFSNIQMIFLIAYELIKWNELWIKMNYQNELWINKMSYKNILY